MDRVGVDGCPGGWIAVGSQAGEAWAAALYPDFAQLMAAVAADAQVLVDIPIGLPAQEKRACDRLARQHLTRLRGSSVFPVPARTALSAADYASACDRNQAALGVRIARQAWNIVPKIREVDAWLLAHDPQQQRVRECHPELAFWAMQGGKPMSHAKKTPEGAAQRLALLQQRLPQAGALYDAWRSRYPRRQVAPDDLLDALALAITAAYGQPLRSLPPQPQYDAAGLRMEITYGHWPQAGA